MRLFAGGSLRQELAPGATQGRLKPDSRRDQDIDVTGLDFLDRADVEIDEFRQAFLGHSFFNPLTTDIGPELLELPLYGGIIRHAPLGRYSQIDENGPMGRNLHAETVEGSG